MKKILSIFLCAVMVLGLIPVTAAAEAPVHTDAAANKELEIGWIVEGEQQVWHCANGTADTQNDLPDGVSFDAGTGTLTLNNADISYVNAWDWGVNRLTIRVEGENRIYACEGRSGISLYTCHDVVISGTGTLDIQAKGRGEDPNGPSSPGQYGTPFEVRDCYVPDRSDEGSEDEGFIYPDGSLVIDGVTVLLTNPESELAFFEDSYWASAYNAWGALVTIARMKLQNGAKLTCKAMDGMGFTANLTVGEGTELTAGAVNVSGIYDERDGLAIRTSLTVNGTLTVTGDCLDEAEDQDAAREVYLSSLRVNPGATLALNEGGVINVTAPSVSNGFGVELQAPHYGEDPAFDALGNANAAIHGGTLTVEAAGAGILVGPNAVWTQDGGTVTVNTTGEVEGPMGMPVGIEIGGDSYEDNTAAFTQSGGTVNVNIAVDGTEVYIPGVRLDGVANAAISGDARLNIRYSGAGTGWFTGIHLYDNRGEEGNLLPAGAAMTVSGNAAVSVDFTGFNGTGEDIGATGVGVEAGSLFTVNGGAVNVTLPNGDLGGGDAVGIGINGGTVTTGGDITVTAPEAMATGRVVGVNLSRGELEDSASVFTVNGGKVTVDIEAATLYESIGISAGGAGAAVNFSGGEVAVTLGGTEKSAEEDEAWNNVVAIDAYENAAVTVDEGAWLDLSILRTSPSSGCVGILLTDRSSYTQAAGTTVTVHGGENVTEASFEGLRAADYNTVSIYGTLTLGAQLNTGISLLRSTLEIADPAHITYDARESAAGDGIMADDYSDITISGGVIDLDVPIVSTDFDAESIWVTGGIYLWDNTTANITGGTININQKDRPEAVGSFETVGLYVNNAFLRVTGGEINLTGTNPLSAFNSMSAADPVTFGNGICALYAETEGDLGGFEVKKSTAVGAVNYCYYDYVLDSENEAPGREFGVVIKNQNARAEYSADLELVNSGVVVAGQSYTARLTASLPSGEDKLTLSVENGTVEENSVSVNGAKAEAAEYAQGGKSVSLTVKSGDIIRFNVIPGAKENTVTAKFETANETESVSFTAKDYTVELPTSTDKETVTVSGVATKGATVQVYVDGTLAASATANQAGVWNTTITLTEGSHTVHATINGSQTENKTIVYKSTLPVVESLTVTNYVHGKTTADPNVPNTFVIDFSDPAKNPRYYTFWPELPEFTFTVKFKEGTGRVADVRVVATDWQGNSEEAVLDSCNAEGNTWTGTHIFGITPEQFRVEWYNPEGSEEQTPDAYEKPQITGWGEPDVEGSVYTPPEDKDERTGSRLEAVTVAPGTYKFNISEGAEITLVSPEGGKLDGSGTSRSVTGQDGDMYVVTVKNGSFVDFDSDVDTLCICFDSGEGGKAYVLAETAAEDDDADVTVGGDYTAPEDCKERTLEYLLVGSRVYRIKKKDESENTYTVEADVTEDEDLDITRVYKSISISNFRSADLEHATLENWDGTPEELIGSIGSVPAIYHINYATGEVTIDADTEALAREFMSSQFAIDLIDSAINVWSEELEKEFGVDGVKCTAKLTASFDILGDTAGQLTVKPEFTITVGTKTKGHFGEISETLTVTVGFESVTSVDYRLTMKRDENGDVELDGFIPKYNGYISVSEDMSFTLGFSVSINGENSTTETDVLSKYFDEQELEKYLDELEPHLSKDTVLPTAKVYIPIPAVPGLGFYFGSSIYYNYKLLGELSVNTEIKTGLQAGVVISDNKIISKTGDLTPATQNTDLKFHAEAGTGIGIRGDFGLSLLRVLEVGVYGQAGPRIDIKGHGHASFGTGRQTEFDAEISIALGLEAKVGTAIKIGKKRESLDFWTTYFTQPDWVLGRKFMPTRFTVREEEPIIVPAEVNLSTVIDMHISYQELVESYEVKSKILDADKYEFQLYESDGKPVTLTQNGDLTVTDKTKAFDFWVKLLYKVHPNDEYQIWKIVPMRYVPAVIEVVKTTEAGGPRVASFTVTDTSTHSSETKVTSEAGLAVFGAELGHTYIITENSCPAGYYPATASQTVTVDSEKVRVNFLNKKIELEWPLQATPNAAVSCCEDPSGYVYEGIESNRLQGVTTTLYTAANAVGTDSAQWDAENYDQTNPLTTDALGQYMWMVPSGYWQVKYELDDYTTQSSEWMQVPPVRTGVNVNMTSSQAATATLEYSEILGCYVLRFSRPVQVSTVREGIGLTGLPDGVVGEIYGLNPLDADWSVVTGDVKNSTLCATAFIIGTFSAWYEESGEPYELTVGTRVDVELTEDVLTYMGTPSPQTASVTVHEQLTDRYRVTVINGTGSGLYAPGEIVKLSYDVRVGYTFTGWSVEPNDPENPLEISSDNTFEMPWYNVVIKAEYIKAGGSSGGGSAVSHPVTLPERVEHGSVTANYGSAVPGSTVTLTVKPDEGYALDALTVTDGDGKTVALKNNGDGTYSFTMPNTGVTVTAVFKCAGGKACPSRKFTDLDANAWYHEYTDYVITANLMRGIGGGLFDPDGTVQRAQMVTVLWHMQGDPVVNYAMAYSDVAEDDWYAEAIRWATSEGVAGGYGNGMFGPTDPITREQMAAMLYRYAKQYGGNGFDAGEPYELPFADAAKVSGWAQEAVSWCSMENILTGKDNNLLDPAGTAKRCEMAAILMRYCQKGTKGEE